nr:hypothetical protein CFP56_19387 [Quercus suber]
MEKSYSSSCTSSVTSSFFQHLSRYSGESTARLPGQNGSCRFLTVRRLGYTAHPICKNDDPITSIIAEIQSVESCWWTRHLRSFCP